MYIYIYILSSFNACRKVQLQDLSRHYWRGRILRESMTLAHFLKQIFSFEKRNTNTKRTRKSFENETGKFKSAKLPTRVHHRTRDETISASRLSSPFSSPCSPAAITLRYHCHPGWLHGAHHDSKFTKSSLALRR